MRYALMGILGGFFLTVAAPAAAPANYPALSLATSTDLSYNWAGWVSEGQGNYQAVSGRWLVPKVVGGPGPLSADATWVGIGGVVSEDLLQAGTQAVVGPDGGVSYQAWLEMMPEASRPVPLAVSAGDEVEATIAQTLPGLWQITIKNNTTGQSYRTRIQYDSTLSSAEWVEEMPASVHGGFIPLDNFSAVRFMAASTTVDGTARGIAEAEGSALTMINRAGVPLAVPSELSATSGFVVARSGAEPTLRQTGPRYAPRRGTYR